LIIIIFLSNIW